MKTNVIVSVKTEDTISFFTGDIVNETNDMIEMTTAKDGVVWLYKDRIISIRKSNKSNTIKNSMKG